MSQNGFYNSQRTRHHCIGEYHKILKDEDKAKPIIEVGAGYGDVTALLYFLEFKNILSFELNRPLIEKINQKILALCGKRPTVINRKYPVKTDHTPGIIIHVNCIYSSSFKTKLDYLEGIRRLYLLNGIPYMFLFESIDDSYREPNDTYPYYVRLNEDDIKQTFPHCKIDSYPTYVYPNNRVSKLCIKYAHSYCASSLAKCWRIILQLFQVFKDSTNLGYEITIIPSIDLDQKEARVIMFQY